MSDPSYGTDARHRLCLKCLEGFVVPLAGGDVSCPACAAAATLRPRKLEPLAEASAFQETAEQGQQRLAILRRQLQSYNRDNKYTFVTAPEGLEDLAKQPEPAPLLQAFAERVGRCEARGSTSAPDERALFWLACRLRSAMSATTEPERVAAVLHTALDGVTDRGFRHALLSRLARLAVSRSDYDAAEAWLALCDPVSTILDLDSDYRVALAMLNGARGDWARVLTLVGDDEWAVPYEPASVALLGALRVAAFEALGRGFEAEDAMRRVIELTPSATPRDVFRKMFGYSPVFAPALKAWQRAEPDQFGVVDTSGTDGIDVVPGASPNAGWLAAAIIVALGGLGLLGVGFYFLGQYQKEHAYKSAPGTLVAVSSRSVGSGKKATIRVFVEYRYVVDGQVHFGRRIETDQSYYSFSSDRSATHKIATLKRRKTFPVYYDPRQPRRAILERQNAAFHAVPFVVTGMLWVVALVLLRQFFVKRREYKKKVEAAARAEAEQEAGRHGAA